MSGPRFHFPLCWPPSKWSFERRFVLFYVGDFLIPNGAEKRGAESEIRFDVNAESTGKSIRRRNRKCRVSCPRVYFVTLATPPKLSKPRFPYLQARDVNSDLLQGWREIPGLGADYMRVWLCDLLFTLHQIPRREVPGLRKDVHRVWQLVRRDRREPSLLPHPDCIFESAL